MNDQEALAWLESHGFAGNTGIAGTVALIKLVQDAYSDFHLETPGVTWGPQS